MMRDAGSCDGAGVSCRIQFFSVFLVLSVVNKCESFQRLAAFPTAALVARRPAR